MVAVNMVVVAGNVTRDLELKYLPSGTAVTDFGLAVNEKYKNSQGQLVEEVSFFDVTLFGKNAEVAHQYLKKGAAVLIQGKLKQDRWDDKSSGEKRQKIKVIGDKMQFLGSKSDGGGGGGHGDHGGQGYGNGNAQPQQTQPRQNAPQQSQQNKYLPPSPQQTLPTPGDDEIPF